MKTISIRGVDSEIAGLLKKLAVLNHESMNKTILKLIQSALGVSQKPVYPIYNDLDKLAGTWSQQDAELFKKNTTGIRKIDKELWK